MSDSEKRMRRRPVYKLVKASDIQTDPDHLYDAEFSRLWSDYQESRITAVFTRFPIDRILAVTPQRKDDKVVSFWKQPIVEEAVVSLANRIRGGYRPNLVLYDAHLDDPKNVLICCDDVHSYHAYLSVGIKLVPATVLNAATSTFDEAGYRVGADGYVSMKAEPPEQVSYHSLLGKNRKHLDDGDSYCISKLQEALLQCSARIKFFHLSETGYEKIHYHQTLYSVVIRMNRGLESIRILLDRELSSQTLPIVRSLYELALLFYVDWVAPERMGPMLQLAGMLSSDTPDDRAQRKKIKQQFGNSFMLASNVFEKANISPLGEMFYRRVYGELSHAAHQDFAVTDLFKNIFEDEKLGSLTVDQIRELITWLDFIVAMVVIRILDDVGGSAEVAR